MTPYNFPQNPHDINNGYAGYQPHNNGVTLVKIGIALYLANKALTDPSSINRGAFNLVKAAGYLLFWGALFYFLICGLDPRTGWFPR